MHNNFEDNYEFRKQLSVFQSLFNQIFVIRRDNKGDEINRFVVPIEYAPKKKYIRRIEGGHDVPQGITLPRMSFEMTSLNLSAVRRRNPLQQVVIRKHLANRESRTYVYTPIPYDFNISLSLYVKNEMDAFQIVKQITSVFQPHYKVDAALFEHDLDTTVPLILKLVGTTPDQNFEGAYEERQTKFWTFDFILMGYIFTDVFTQDRIKQIDIGIFPTFDIEESETSNYDAPSLVTIGEIAQNQTINVSNISQSILGFNVDKETWISTQGVPGMEVDDDTNTIGLDAGEF